MGMWYSYQTLEKRMLLNKRNRGTRLVSNTCRSFLRQRDPDPEPELELVAVPEVDLLAWFWFSEAY